ncbi:hypothetical protein [Cetobacterium sp.]
MEIKFMLASLIFAMTPGLATVYILSNSTLYGRKEGLKSALGVMSGGCIRFNFIGDICNTYKWIRKLTIVFDYKNCWCRIFNLHWNNRIKI